MISSSSCALKKYFSRRAWSSGSSHFANFDLIIQGCSLSWKFGYNP